MLQPLEIPKWKWESISMDFMIGLPKTQVGFDEIWVIVDRLTKSTQFLPIRATYPLEKYNKTTWCTFNHNLGLGPEVYL